MKIAKMNNNPDNDADDLHLQRIRRKLVRLMLSSLIITFVLVGLVLAAVIYKIMSPSEQSASIERPLEQLIDLSPGDTIISYSLSGNVIVLWKRDTTQDDETLPSSEFIFYDYHQGRILSRLKLNNRYSPAIE